MALYQSRGLIAVCVILVIASLVGCGGSAEPGAQPSPGEEPDTPEPAPAEPEEVPAAELIAKGQSLDGYHYRYVMTLPDDTSFTHKVWVKSGKMRSEMENPVTGEETVAVVNITSNEVYLYQPKENMAFKMSLEQSELDTVTPLDYLEQYNPPDMVYMNRETFDGKHCIVYESRIGDTLGRIWIWEDHGVPLKVEMASGQDVVRAEFLDFQIGDLDENLFRLPPGVQIIELGG